MRDAWRDARDLAKRIAGISDPAVRVQYLRAVLLEMEPDRVAALITVAMHRTEARDGEQGALLLATCLALADDSASTLREEVARAAVASGQHQTASLLSHRPPARDEPVHVPDFGAGRPLTLGERKSLARRRDRDLLARVLRDPHPDVIKILLENPALTEDDVTRLCARRPIAAEVLRQVFRSTRWIVRYRVRLSIVRNPYAPIDIALQLAAHLNQQDAREVSASPELSTVLREACERVAGLATIH